MVQLPSDWWPYALLNVPHHIFFNRFNGLRATTATFRETYKRSAEKVKSHRASPIGGGLTRKMHLYTVLTLGLVALCNAANKPEAPKNSAQRIIIGRRPSITEDFIGVQRSSLPRDEEVAPTTFTPASGTNNPQVDDEISTVRETMVSRLLGGQYPTTSTAPQEDTTNHRNYWETVESANYPQPIHSHEEEAEWEFDMEAYYQQQAQHEKKVQEFEQYAQRFEQECEESRQNYDQLMLQLDSALQQTKRETEKSKLKKKRKHDTEQENFSQLLQQMQLDREEAQQKFDQFKLESECTIRDIQQQFEQQKQQMLQKRTEEEQSFMKFAEDTLQLHDETLQNWEEVQQNSQDLIESTEILEELESEYEANFECRKIVSNVRLLEIEQEFTKANSHFEEMKEDVQKRLEEAEKDLKQTISETEQAIAYGKHQFEQFEMKNQHEIKELEQKYKEFENINLIQREEARQEYEQCNQQLWLNLQEKQQKYEEKLRAQQSMQEQEQYPVTEQDCHLCAHGILKSPFYLFKNSSFCVEQDFSNQFQIDLGDSNTSQDQSNLIIMPLNYEVIVSVKFDCGTIIFEQLGRNSGFQIVEKYFQNPSNTRMPFVGFQGMRLGYANTVALENTFRTESQLREIIFYHIKFKERSVFNLTLQKYSGIRKILFIHCGLNKEERNYLKRVASSCKTALNFSQEE